MQSMILSAAFVTHIKLWTTEHPQHSCPTGSFLSSPFRQLFLTRSSATAGHEHMCALRVLLVPERVPLGSQPYQWISWIMMYPCMCTLQDIHDYPTLNCMAPVSSRWLLEMYVLTWLVVQVVTTCTYQNTVVHVLHTCIFRLKRNLFECHKCLPNFTKNTQQIGILSHTEAATPCCICQNDSIQEAIIVYRRKAYNSVYNEIRLAACVNLLWQHQLMCCDATWAHIKHTFR